MKTVGVNFMSRRMGRNSSHLANVNKVKELALPSLLFCLPASMPPSSHLIGLQRCFPACRMQGFPSVLKWIFAFIAVIAAVAFIDLVIRVFIQEKPSEHPQTTKCSGKWIGVGDKCFYFSEDTKNWTASKIFCSSQGSELAQIDTPGDMEFLKKHTGTSMHWIGLSRKQGEPWKWTNGTTFNAWFEIDGNGLFAFLNGDGVYSSRGFVDIKWICSKPRF